jgi:hypothetical protein
MLVWVKAEDRAKPKDLERAYERSGETDYWEEQLKDEKIRRSENQEYVPAIGIAKFAAQLGLKDEAFKSLGEAYQEHDVYLTWIKVDPAYDNLSTDTRFTELL